MVELKKELSVPWSFEIVEQDGKQIVKPPVPVLPKFVCERLEWLDEYLDNGTITFMGALEAMTDTTGQTEKEFSLVGEWKPFSPEYIDWIEAMPSVRAMELAFALMYNYQVDEHSEQVDLGV